MLEHGDNVERESEAITSVGERGLARVESALKEIQDKFKGLPALGGVTAVKHFPARAALCVPFPESISPRLVSLLKARGFESLFAHQALAYQHAQEHKNVVVVTPTASGKTLCYNLPILNALVENPEARAMYLFPTKALSQDQLVELNRWTEKLGAWSFICSSNLQKKFIPLIRPTAFTTSIRLARPAHPAARPERLRKRAMTKINASSIAIPLSVRPRRTNMVSRLGDFADSVRPKSLANLRFQS